MADYPKTLMEFEYQFSTEEACREYLFRLRWPSGFRCTMCGHDKAWTRTDGLFECQGCEHKASIKAGTIFEGSRKPLVLSAPECSCGFAHEVPGHNQGRSGPKTTGIQDVGVTAVKEIHPLT